jgi:Ca-activated chloride channel homolog
MNVWSSVEFMYPYVLLGLILCIYGAWRSLAKRKKTNFLIVLPHAGNKTFPKTLKTKLYPYLPVLYWLALAFMCIALARPRLPLQEEKVTSDGIDIMMVLDLSSSMLAKDFSPNRLEACKLMAGEFVRKRYNDRIGVVIFGGEAYTLCPLTTDHQVVVDLISQINVGILADNTAIGMGLATAVKRLKDSESASKVIILLTDGENNAGYIDPKTATDLAINYDVKIYTIAVGTTGVAMMPSNIFGHGRDVPTRVSIDTELLTYIAESTNGKFFRAQDNEGLQEIYNEIDRLEKSKIEQNVFKRYSEYFRPFLLTALFLMFLSVLLQNTYFKNIQRN